MAVKKDTTYVALLRGINVGGNKKVPMLRLKSVLEKAGYSDVRTLLASGNVAFGSPEKNCAFLTTKLETLLQKNFGFSVPTIIRTMGDIRELTKSDPFKKITITKDIRLYVTFLSGAPKHTILIPYISPDKSFQIIGASKDKVISVLDVSKAGTIEAMGILEKEIKCKTLVTKCIA